MSVIMTMRVSGDPAKFEETVAARHRAGHGGGRRDLATERDFLAHARHGGRRRLGSLSAPFSEEGARLVDRPIPGDFGRAMSQAERSAGEAASLGERCSPRCRLSRKAQLRIMGAE